MFKRKINNEAKQGDDQDNAEENKGSHNGQCHHSHSSLQGKKHLRYRSNTEKQDHDLQRDQRAAGILLQSFRFFIHIFFPL
jgi:hypothetical protein